MSEAHAVEAQPELFFITIPAENAPFIWPQVYGILKPAVDVSEGRWTMTALLNALCVGNHVLWVCMDKDDKIHGAWTTQIAHYSSRKFVAIQFLGGENMHEWFDEGLARVEDYARHCGCDGLETVARAGFWPNMKRTGFDRSGVFYSKLLGDS